MSATTLKPGSVAIPAVAAAMLYSGPKAARKERADAAAKRTAEQQDVRRERDAASASPRPLRGKE